MQEKGNKCNPFQSKGRLEVKGFTGSPFKSSSYELYSYNACDAGKDDYGGG